MAGATKLPAKESAERLAKALRDNLRRRKDQARAQEQLAEQRRKEAGKSTA